MEASKLLFKYRKRIAAVLASGLFLKNGLPHLFPSNLFMPFNASMECSKYPLDHQIWLIRNTKQDMGITNDILPFITNTPNVICAGFFAFSKWKPDPVLGIPKNFFCTNVYEVEELNIKITGSKYLDSARSPNEKALLESLIFSEAAQKFAVARWLVYLKDNWALWQSLLSPMFVVLGYLAFFHGPKFLFKKGKNISLTHILQWQLFCIILTWLLCKLTRSALNHWMVYSTDAKAAQLTEEYALGGIEYYENIRECNKAWRILGGSKGEQSYTVYGNEKDGLIVNWKGPSLSDRQNRLQNILKSFQN